jgi:hypothetical protein
MKIERKHIHLFETLGRNSFIDTPANMEFADGTPATDKDFRVLASLRAALAVFKTMGVVAEDVTIDLREPYQP